MYTKINNVTSLGFAKTEFCRIPTLPGANCHKAKKIPLKRGLFSSPCFRWYKQAYPNGTMKTKNPWIVHPGIFLAL